MGLCRRVAAFFLLGFFHSPVHASTITDFKLDLEYVGSSFILNEVGSLTANEEHSGPSVGILRDVDDRWGFPLLFQHLSPDQRLAMSYRIAEGPAWDGDYYVAGCRFNGSLCMPDFPSNGQYSYPPYLSTGSASLDGAFALAGADIFSIAMPIPILGAAMTIFDTDPYGSGGWAGFSYSKDDWLANIWIRETTFKIVGIEAFIAPVPLPASAALLPIGLATFVSFTRRRRRPNRSGQVIDTPAANRVHGIGAPSQA